MDRVYTAATHTKVFRASVAYIVQHMKAFVKATSEKSEVDSLQQRAIDRFHTLCESVHECFEAFGDKWPELIVPRATYSVHQQLDEYREELTSITQQMGLDPEEIIKFDKGQDTVNKISDLQSLKELLKNLRQETFSVTNAVDIQQQIELRLESINRRLPQRRVDRKNSVYSFTANQIKEQVESALIEFESIEIPLNDIRQGKPLGAGGFGSVFLGTRLSTGELLAVKEVKVDKMTMSSWASLYAELATMAKLRHRHILELVGAHTKDPYRIITRFCPGKSLFDRLHKTSNKLTPRQLTRLALQIAEGMEFLHKNKVVHRDLKTMNILLDDTNSAMIADFGLSGKIKKQGELFGGVGTPHYTAPEVLEHKHYTEKVDVFSYGVMLWEMATQSIPYREKNYNQIYDFVVTRKWRLDIPKTVDPSMAKLIARCWDEKPSVRPDFSEIVRLFKSGKCSFNFEPLNPSEFEAEHCAPPIDIQYVITVLANTSNPQYASVAHFLSQNIDDRVAQTLQGNVSFSVRPSDNQIADSFLLLAASILPIGEMGNFIETKAVPIITDIGNRATSAQQKAFLQFFLKIPEDFIPKAECLLPYLFMNADDTSITDELIQLAAKLPDQMFESVVETVVWLYRSGLVIDVSEQVSADAALLILRKIVGQLESQELATLSYLFANPFLPNPQATNLLIENLTDNERHYLFPIVLTTAGSPGYDEAMISVVTKCSNCLPQLIMDEDFPSQIQAALQLSPKSTLLFVFALAQMESFCESIIDSQLIDVLLNMKGHERQRMQVFTALCLDERFFDCTPYADSIIKFAVKMMNDDSLATYAIKLIGSITTHYEGCRKLHEAGVASLAVQMVLSPVSGDTISAVIALCNMAEKKVEIPQISLIISCLMQDLLQAHSKKAALLYYLTKLITRYSNLVQEQDVITVVIPLLNPQTPPDIVTLALKLLLVCDTTIFKNIYKTILDLIYNVLRDPKMHNPQLIEAAARFINATSLEMDIKQFIEKTDLIGFLQKVFDRLDPDSLVSLNLGDVIYTLQHTGGPVNFEDSILARFE